MSLDELTYRIRKQENKNFGDKTENQTSREHTTPDLGLQYYNH